MVTQSDVIMAYRLLLDREPESEETVLAKANHHKTLHDLSSDVLLSAEFLDRFLNALRQSLRPKDDFGAKPVTWPPIKVDVTCPPEIVNRMVERIESEFAYLGEHDPHWSVLTDERFRADNISATMDEFYQSGAAPVAEFSAAAERCGVDLACQSTCFELGCGVGRSTVWLARRFPRLVAGDISAAHLEHARKAAALAGHTNISFTLLDTLNRYDELPPFDTFFSLIVLQHNPPPVMAMTLEAILNRLQPGGLAYFQIPTYRVGYGFSAAEYLRTERPVGDVEVHCLPQPDLFELIARTNCRLLEMREDTALGFETISNRLLLRKNA